MRLSDGSWLATDEEVERLNRIAYDVFHVRYGRPYDARDTEDQLRMRAIGQWQTECCPLPDESKVDHDARCAMLRGLRELIDP